MPFSEAQTITKYPSLFELATSKTISPEDARRIGQTAKFAVSFGSTQLPDLSDFLKNRIAAIDTASRHEAEQSGELVHYHDGDVDPLTLVAFSACFWTSRRAAALALHGPVHLGEAIPLAKSGTIYSHYQVQFHTVHQDNDFGFTTSPYLDIHNINVGKE